MIDPEIRSAIQIQTIWRGFYTRYRDSNARWTMRWNFDRIVEVDDCVYHNNKHPMTQRDYVYDERGNYYCDWCSLDINTDRYTCAFGCDFDLCINCGDNERHTRLKNFVTF